MCLHLYMYMYICILGEEENNKTDKFSQIKLKKINIKQDISKNVYYNT